MITRFLAECARLGGSRTSDVGFGLWVSLDFRWCFTADMDFLAFDMFECSNESTDLDRPIVSFDSKRGDLLGVLEGDVDDLSGESA